MKIYIDETGNVDPKDHVECLGFGGLILPECEATNLAKKYATFKKTNNIIGEFKINDPKTENHKELVRKFKIWLHKWIKDLKRIRADSQIFAEVLIVLELEDKSNTTEYEKFFLKRLNLIKNDYPDLYEGKGNDFSTIYNASLLSMMINCMQKFKVLKKELEPKLEFIIDRHNFNEAFLKKPLNKYYLNIRNKLEKYYSVNERCENVLPLDIKITFSDEDPILEIIHNLITLCKWEKFKKEKSKLSKWDRFVTQYRYLFVRDDGFTHKIFQKVESGALN